ncbi:geranylgeranyl reductase family protein [Lunatibacter salilacus]|uniref:geranylgeranyl reductase family protein n=1 Tax=Lunatibacter salilacus TaxID=2483804 RepID=UPI00131C16E4|nr:geranylgeranyl reductase family protein [Lunatibacter salilacus]
MNSFDVVVVGAGPSGAMAAYEAAAGNLSVCILEKKVLPRYKTCGGGLVYRGKRKLPFEISEAVSKTYNDLAVYFDHSPISFTTSRDKPIISMVMRDTFDHLLVNKAKERGVVVMEDSCVLEIESKGEILLKTSNGNISTRFLIAADGAYSPTAKLFGWKETRKLIPALEYEIIVSEADFNRLSNEVRFDVDAIPYGYGWCFPKENHLSVGVGCFKHNNISLKEYYRKYLKTLGINEILREEAHGFQIPISPRTDGFYRNGAFLIGDAAGFADPLTAEGISNAIYSGQMAGRAIAQHPQDPYKAGGQYEQLLNEDLLHELKISGFLSKIFYENPRLRNLLVDRYGQRGCEILTDIFMGDRKFPKDIRKKLKEKIPFLPF